MEAPFLADRLKIPREERLRIERLYETCVLKDPGLNPARVLGEEFNLDLAARYGDRAIAHPIGKASGQLSLATRQIEADAEACIAFVVLKTVIAEDEGGDASMHAWKISEPRMEVERIRGKRIDREGWTVSWAGRGWEGSLASYIQFMGEALDVGANGAMPVIPSCKFHLPSRPEEAFLSSEYEHTARELEAAWKRVLPGEPMILEQDFSPTLAGDDMAGSKSSILKWLTESPALIKAATPRCRLGVKLMNALFEDDFQLETMNAVCRKGTSADFIICFNRLFDPEREFGEKKGIAVGGPDLSDRNLTVLGRAMRCPDLERPLPISATGDIDSGKTLIEYALRGASSAQVHTFFQLPLGEYRIRGVSRSRAALHELYFHPQRGVAAAMCWLRDRLGRGREEFKFLELAALGRELLANREALRS